MEYPSNRPGTDHNETLQMEEQWTLLHTHWKTLEHKLDIALDACVSPDTGNPVDLIKQEVRELPLLARTLLAPLPHDLAWRIGRPLFAMLARCHITVKHRLLTISNGYKDVRYGGTRPGARDLPGFISRENDVHHLDKRGLGGSSFQEMLIRLDHTVHQLLHLLIDDLSRERLYSKHASALGEDRHDTRHGRIGALSDMNHTLMELMLSRLDKIESLSRNMLLHEEARITVAERVIYPLEERSYRKLRALTAFHANAKKFRHELLLASIDAYAGAIPVYLQNVEYFHHIHRYHMVHGAVTHFRRFWNSIAPDIKKDLGTKIPSLLPLFTHLSTLYSTQPQPYQLLWNRTEDDRYEEHAETELRYITACDTLAHYGTLVEKGREDLPEELLPPIDALLTVIEEIRLQLG